MIDRLRLAEKLAGQATRKIFPGCRGPERLRQRPTRADPARVDSLPRQGRRSRGGAALRLRVRTIPAFSPMSAARRSPLQPARAVNARSCDPHQGVPAGRAGARSGQARHVRQGRKAARGQVRCRLSRYFTTPHRAAVPADRARSHWPLSCSCRDWVCSASATPRGREDRGRPRRDPVEVVPMPSGSALRVHSDPHLRHRVLVAGAVQARRCVAEKPLARAHRRRHLRAPGHWCRNGGCLLPRKVRSGRARPRTSHR